MKPPNWLAEMIATQGDLVLRGKKTRAEADAEIAAATEAHPEFGQGLAAASALGMFGRWVRNHTSSGDLFQAQMLEGLPATMLVAPKKPMQVADMTGDDLDHAKNMLYARTTNAVRGVREAAMAERRVFDQLYDRVRHLLKGEMTVSQVLAEALLAAAPEQQDEGHPDWLVLAVARMEPEAVAAEIEKHPEYMRRLLVGIANGMYDGLSLAEAIKAASGTAA